MDKSWGNRRKGEQSRADLWPQQHIVVDGQDVYVDAPSGGYKLGDYDLPVAKKRVELDGYFKRQAEGEVPVGIVIGETGSGKTSNVPLAALESEQFSKIYVGEPRVVLARETMLRLRENIVQRLGESAVNLVGYAAGLERDLHPDNRIVVGTYRLIRHKIEDANEADLEHAALFVDEYHVREIEGDLLMEAGKYRQVPVTAVSATIDADRTARFHCSNDGSTPAPIIRIEGRQYPIEEMYMNDSTEAAVWAAARGLDAIYMLPGKSEIQSEMGRVGARQSHVALPLHGELPPAAQRRALEPSTGLPHVIYGTEIMGQGITPPSTVGIVTNVVRATKLVNGAPVLGYEQPSAARIRQYMGRVGRTEKGYVIHAPLANGPADLPPNNKEYDTPEIRRTRLDGVVLSLARTAKTLCDDPIVMEHSHRVRLIDEPDQLEVFRAQERLRRIGALAIDMAVTDTGREMSRLPLDPSYARMVVESRQYGDAIRHYMAAAAAVAQMNGVSMTSSEFSPRWSEMSNEQKSDMLRGLDMYLSAKEIDPSQYDYYGILPQRVDLADRMLVELCSREGIEVPEAFEKPSEAQRRDLRRCMLSGIDELYVRSSAGGKYVNLDRSDVRMLPRESAVSNAPLVAATPWGLEVYKENGPIRRLDFLKNVVDVDVATLLEVVPERCDMVYRNYELSEEGEVIACKELIFDGKATGQFERVAIEGMTPELREFAIHGVLRSSVGDESILPIEVQRFREELRDLYELHHCSREGVEIDVMVSMIQDELKQRIPEDVQSLEELRKYFDSNIVRGQLTNAQRREIILSAPKQVQYERADGMPGFVPVSYQNHAAIVHCRDYNELRMLPDQFAKLEGRILLVQVGDEDVQNFYEAKRLYVQSRKDRRSSSRVNVPWIDEHVPRPKRTNYDERLRIAKRQFRAQAHR